MSPPAKTAVRPKWRRRAEARPDEILDAALAEFGENGFDATRLDAVAERAGLSKGALYLYFESKDAILTALIERQVAPVARAMRTLAENGLETPAATLHALLAAFASVIQRPDMAAVPKIVFSIAPRFPAIAAYYRENVIEEGLAAVKALHRAGVAKGVFRPADSDQAARLIVGPLLMQVLFVHVFGGAPPATSPETQAKGLADLVMRGLGAEGF